LEPITNRVEEKLRVTEKSIHADTAKNHTTKKTGREISFSGSQAKPKAQGQDR
jgi:hypothetical protein